MINHAWSVLCNEAFIDKDSNRVSLSILEALTISGEVVEPAPGTRVLVPTRIVLVSLWYCEAGGSDFEFRVTTIGPRGETDHHPVKVTAFPADKTRFRTKVNFPGLLFDGVGTYRYQVARAIGDEWKTEAEIPLHVEFGPAQFVASGDAVMAAPPQA